MTVVELLLGGLALLAARQVHVWIYPLKPCPRCHGSCKNKSGEAFRRCGRCDSTGEVRRWGAGRGDR